jgi:hypothetical protein
MREIDPEFELLDIARVEAGVWTVGHGSENEIARLGKTQETGREFKNTGNKAKEWLKTKHITFLKCAIAAPFACKLAQIGR